MNFSTEKDSHKSNQVRAAHMLEKVNKHVIAVVKAKLTADELRLLDLHDESDMLFILYTENLTDMYKKLSTLVNVKRVQIGGDAKNKVLKPSTVNEENPSFVHGLLDEALNAKIGAFVEQLKQKARAAAAVAGHG